MLEIDKIKYPELNNIVNLYPNQEILLGREIIYQEKIDGSNIGCYLDDKYNVHIRSRNLVDASEDFQKIFLETEEHDKIKELLTSMRDDWNDECVIFGELLIKGKSPTRTEFHVKNEFIAFDIWSSKIGDFIPYTLVYQYTYHFKLPIVDLYGTSKHSNIESLYKFRDEMLELAKENGKEGVVGKTFEKNHKFKYFKEKLDYPPIYKRRREIDDGKPILPPLSESEIFGALDKVLVDLGIVKFKDKSIAMPLFAKYVIIEQNKHHCSKPNKKLFGYYTERLEEEEMRIFDEDMEEIYRSSEYEYYNDE